MGTEIEGGHIGESEIHVALGRPAAFAVEIGDFQFVDPHHTVFRDT